MFISDKFCFLELHKTGCTHIRNILNELFDGELIGKHNQAYPELFSGKRVFLGSVRDPWGWYTSLWGYGCDNKGVVFQNVTRYDPHRELGWVSNPFAVPSENPREWMDTYKNINDAGAFRAWLRMMNDANYFTDIGEGYGLCSVNRVAGFTTYRYLKLFCTKLGEQEKLNRLFTFEQIKNYENDNCFIDRFIRIESLEDDLFRVLEESGVKIPSNIKSEILEQPKTNISSRKHGSEFYYDIESENLVAERERLIIEKFGYVAPSLRAKA